MLKKNWIWAFMALAAMSLIAGIFIKNNGQQAKANAAHSDTQKSEVRTLRYLEKNYVIPVKTEKIVVTGALEALEDLLVLGVKPVGMMSIGGTFPPMFAEISREAKPIGERMQPNFEAILKLRPDVIVSSDKFPAAVTEQLQRLAPVIPISHYPRDGEANLRLLGEMTGRQDRVEAVLQSYRQSIEAAARKIPADVKGKRVLAIRIRAGSISVYPPDVFFNEILYGQLGLPVPEELKSVKTQQIVSLEKFSEMNPDYIFLQYAVSESSAQPKVLEDLQQNAIWQSLKAVKNNHVFINSVDPLIQGVAIGGKIQFLNAAVERLSQ